MFRIGQGFDFHPFQEGRRLLLGGVEIPHRAGLKGHSDADALLHAVCDALLGAAGMRDIGSYFPDDDPAYKDISSLILLEKVQRLVRGKGWKVANLDLTVIAEEPKIKPHVEAIEANLCRTLHIKPEQVGVKATTMEGAGAVGRREGIAVMAVVLLTAA
ncbi:MAG TPA: 2-C-methyl-D-erythritol 2,4-cyclodiphosphate synthase [Acidobacteriota bacterium]|nr:2-C-methyl-D-erythritol 2,4-cyclodiphosphate synthase [Acidobacteriota bacterium]